MKFSVFGLGGGGQNSLWLAWLAATASTHSKPSLRLAGLRVQLVGFVERVLGGAVRSLGSGAAAW